MEPWAKAYILALALFGAGALMRQATDDTMWISAGVVAAIVCVALGTFWLIASTAKKRRNKA